MIKIINDLKIKKNQSVLANYNTFLYLCFIRETNRLLNPNKQNIYSNYIQCLALLF